MAWKLTNEQIRLAQETEKKYGVPASVTLGQFITESGAGTSSLFKQSNNGFGITGSYKGSYVTYKGRKWRKYNSLAESFDDHGRLLASPLYANKTAGANTLGEYIDAFVPTYAPESDGNAGYSSLLKDVIRDNNLEQYDGSWQGKAGDLGTGGTSETSSSSDSWWNETLAVIIRFIFIAFLVILGVLFFTKAFGISPVPKKVRAAKAMISGGESND